ncbi:hypothetical protein L6261_01970 [Candidatus Parcubacteria bacterium]|nr:hypothetical protein [Candidatus Parcubacteria bacterium]
MQIQFSNDAQKEYVDLEKGIKKQAKKQFDFLLENPRYNSLNIKKYNEELEIWQGRINKDWRFYFHIIGNVYYIFKITKHPK